MTRNEDAVDWSVLAEKRVIFGHQSVGNNIISGISQLAERDGVTIAINERRGGPLSPGLTHFKIGKNEDPLSKIEDFSGSFANDSFIAADIALMKLCYIDFNADSPAAEIAKAYADSIDKLAEQHPDTLFIAVTSPITTIQTGPKAWIKKLLGRSPAQYQENLRRSEFNSIIRDRFASDGHLFDLARVEAEANGQRTTFQIDGKEVEAMAPEITYDGGHLNERGQRRVAHALLEYLSSLNSR